MEIEKEYSETYEDAYKIVYGHEKVYYQMK